jgi:TonB family protein
MRKYKVQQNALITSLVLHLLVLLALFLFALPERKPKPEYLTFEIVSSGRSQMLDKRSDERQASVGKLPAASRGEKANRLPVRRNLLNREETIENSARRSLSEDQDDENSGLDSLLSVSEDIGQADYRPGQSAGKGSTNDNPQLRVRDSGTGLTDGSANGNDLFKISWRDGRAREVLYQVIPEFPEDVSRSAEIDLRFVVSADGRVIRVQPLKKGNMRLENEAMRALRQWRFNAVEGFAEQSGEIRFRFVLQ